MFAVAVMVDVLVGTTFGTRLLVTAGILKALGLAPVIAGAKLVGVY